MALSIKNLGIPMLLRFLISLKTQNKTSLKIKEFKKERDKKKKEKEKAKANKTPSKLYGLKVKKYLNILS